MKIVSLAITNTPALNKLTDLAALKQIDECKRGIELVPASRIVANLWWCMVILFPQAF